MKESTQEEDFIKLEQMARKREETYLNGGSKFTALAMIWSFLALLVTTLRKAPF